MGYDNKIFGNKSLASLMQEIHQNAINREEKVNSLIGDLKDLVEDLQDSTILVPLIRDYLDISVKNNEQLIKLAQIIQRIETADGNGDSNLPDFEELQSLLEDSNKLTTNIKEKPENTSDNGL